MIFNLPTGTFVAHGLLTLQGFVIFDSPVQEPYPTHFRFKVSRPSPHVVEQPSLVHSPNLASEKVLLLRILDKKTP